ncbi:MAG: polysaccharide deacetylase family protein [Sedimentisphaerales bacterium]|nr:polysaccharide deacetylase family protein [Sedimentisphaerales bacterium]
MKIIILISVVVLIFLYLPVPWIYSKILVMSLRRKLAQKPSLVLTFDDGPGDTLTLSILDILKKHNAKATFFLLGKNIEGREEVVKQIAEQGHEIGTHGFDHLNYWRVNPLKSISDINKGIQEINKALDKKNKTYPFRPPFGKLNFISLLNLCLRKFPIIYWTCDIGDTHKNIQTNNKIEISSSVVLAHDYERKNQNTARMVLGTIDKLLREAKQKDLPVLTVSQFIRGSGS